MTTLDLLTLLSYVALNVDILFQIRRIYRTKSSHDLSLVGMSIRYSAILIILAKFISLSDLPLMLGQGLIVLTFTTYLALALYSLRSAIADRQSNRPGGCAIEVAANTMLFPLPPTSKST